MFEQTMTLKRIELKRKFSDPASIREMLQDYVNEYYDELKKEDNKDRVFHVTDEVQRIQDRWDGIPNDTGDRVRHNYINEFLVDFHPDSEVRFHSGQRSFCTNHYLDGVSMEKIMIQSGHASVKVFMNYVQASGIEILYERSLIQN